MPTRFSPRRAPCAHCGDTVLVVEQTAGKLFGLRVRKEPTWRLEHADPGPAGELFDGVDDACERPRVR